MSENEKIQQVIDAALGGREAPVILEAGCGSLSHVRFPAGAHVVGIDISQDQLDRNRGLQERIHGDIQSYPLPAGRFDAIVCWDVLEHLKQPTAALRHFATAVREGGIVVLCAPNPLSAKGIVTRWTPYRFHLWFYRNIRGWKEAGTGGNPPFPTYLRLAIAPGAIRNFARHNNLEVLHERVFGHGDSRDVIGRKSRPVDLLMKVLNGALWLVTLGRVHPGATQCYFVLRRLPATVLAIDR